MTNKELVKYWEETSQHDYDTMIALFESKRYDASLFFGHIILEKAIKALVVKETEKEAPYSHNLLMLAELAKINLTSDELDFLAEVNRFNMRTRYPDAKFKFYKICDKEYTHDNLKKIKKLYKKLCQII
ncbi:MAG: HEPN domain-containing protein [bacterium]